MARIDYTGKEFTGERGLVIDLAANYCRTFAAQGYSLTLRQLYYQFIGDDSFPESWREKGAGSGTTKNIEKNYKRLGKLLSDARLAGYIDWNHIKDRGRGVKGTVSGMSDPSEAFEDLSFFMNRWEGQDTIVEVWVEKEALLEVIGRAAWRWDAPHFACKGYTSQTAMWEAAQRIRGYIEGGHRVKIIHLGDHDPSGIDMTRDVEDRMTDFIAFDLAQDLGVSHTFGDRLDGDPWLEAIDAYGINPFEERDHRVGVFSEGVFDVRRIALNMDQVEAYNPPPSPTKITDSRAQAYIDVHGHECWELDALNPSQLDSLVQNAVSAEIDLDVRNELLAREREGQNTLALIGAHYDEVAAFVAEQFGDE